MWSFTDFETRWVVLGFNFTSKERMEYKNELFINYWNEKTKIQADFSIQWYDLHDADTLIPKLEVFEDSWLALYQCGQDFLKMLAKNDNKRLSKEEMKSKLLEIGFVDKTLDEI